MSRFSELIFELKYPDNSTDRFYVAVENPDRKFDSCWYSSISTSMYWSQTPSWLKMFFPEWNKHQEFDLQEYELQYDENEKCIQCKAVEDLLFIPEITQEQEVQISLEPIITQNTQSISSSRFFSSSQPSAQESKDWDFDNPPPEVIFLAFISVIGWPYLIYLLINAVLERWEQNNQEQAPVSSPSL